MRIASNLLSILVVAWSAVLCPGQVTINIGPDLPGASIRPLLGVNAGPTPAGERGNADLTSQYRDIGVNSIRTHDYYGAMDMAVIYPNPKADPDDPSSYDFRLSDAIYRAILEGGFEPYLRLGDSYNNVRPVTNLQNWARASVQVVKHFHDARLWQRAPLRYVEIYNEPDNGHFWKGRREDFFTLFAQTAKMLKQAFPELKIGGPGWAPTGFMTPQGRGMSRGFLEFCRAQSVPLDFLSFHVYSNDPSDYLAAGNYYRSLLDAHGYRSAELHITEWNTENPERGDRDPSVRTGARGAAINTAAWIHLQELGIAFSAFYRGNDTSPDLPTFFGLFFAGGRPKPVAHAFRLWSEMTAYAQRLQTKTSGGDLRVLGGRNPAGEIALLMANTAPGAVSFRVEGLPAGPGTLTVEEINPADPLPRHRSWNLPAGTIPGHSVQLVQWKRAASSPQAPPRR